MGSRNSDDKNFLDVYNSVITLVGECKRYVEENKDTLNNYTPKFVFDSFKTVTIKTHRRSGLTTSSVRLFRQDENNVLFTFNGGHKVNIITEFNMDKYEQERVFNISKLQSLEFVKNFHHTPKLFVFDTASLNYEGWQEDFDRLIYNIYNKLPSDCIAVRLG